MARFQTTAIHESSRSILNYLVSPAPHDPFPLTTELLCSLRIAPTSSDRYMYLFLGFCSSSFAGWLHRCIWSSNSRLFLLAKKFTMNNTRAIFIIRIYAGTEEVNFKKWWVYFVSSLTKGLTRHFNTSLINNQLRLK